MDLVEVLVKETEESIREVIEEVLENPLSVASEEDLRLELYRIMKGKENLGGEYEVTFDNGVSGVLSLIHGEHPCLKEEIRHGEITGGRHDLVVLDPRKLSQNKVLKKQSKLIGIELKFIERRIPVMDARDLMKYDLSSFLPRFESRADYGYLLFVNRLARKEYELYSNDELKELESQIREYCEGRGITNVKVYFEQVPLQGRSKGLREFVLEF